MQARRWPVAVGLIAGVVAIALAFHTGVTAAEQFQLAARWTARASFPLLILVYSASSLLRLFPGPATKALVRDRRWWGLAFALAHAIHLAALTLYLSYFGERPALGTLLGGGLAYVLLLAMAATSTDRAQAAMGRNWKRLHTAGIHWLWFIFAFSYAGRVLRGDEMPYAAIALGVALFALQLRIIAWATARARRKRSEDPAAD